MSSASRRLRIVADPSRNPAGSGGSKWHGAQHRHGISWAGRSDDELVRHAADGAREAFDELVRRTHRDAYGLALRLTGHVDDASDVVQEAYLRAFRALPRFRGDAQFSTWLYRIVANCASTALGKRARNRHEELPDEASVVEHRVDHDPALQADAAALRSDLDRAIAELPARLRAVVVLRDVYDLPHEAIAEELGISVSAAKVRLHRARRRLREHIHPLPGDHAHAI